MGITVSRAVRSKRVYRLRLRRLLSAAVLPLRSNLLVPVRAFALFRSLHSRSVMRPCMPDRQNQLSTGLSGSQTRLSDRLRACYAVCLSANGACYAARFSAYRFHG